MKQVIITAPISQLFTQTLLDKGYELVAINNSIQLTEVNTTDVIGIITSNKLLLDKLSLEPFNKLQWIARLGSGMEIIDTSYCDLKGIRYFSSPNGIANSVAEHVIGMLLSLQHKIHSSFEEIKHGQWIREANRGMELEDMTCGIIGYGHTGTALANKMCVFTKHVLIFDKYKQGVSKGNIRQVSLSELQHEADIISFHVPLNNETQHYYNADFSSQCYKPHILINSSRGPIVETKALFEALQSGKIIGACLDVLEEEKQIETLLHQPNNIIHSLLKYPVIITPHIAGYSVDAIEKMSKELMAQLNELL